MRIVLDAYTDYPQSDAPTLVFEPLERMAGEKYSVKVSIFDSVGGQRAIRVRADELRRALETM